MVVGLDHPALRPAAVVARFVVPGLTELGAGVGTAQQRCPWAGSRELPREGFAHSHQRGAELATDGAVGPELSVEIVPVIAEVAQTDRRRCVPLSDLAAGGDVNARDEDGDASLHLAAGSVHDPRVITALLEAGALLEMAGLLELGGLLEAVVLLELAGLLEAVAQAGLEVQVVSMAARSPAHSSSSIPPIPALRSKTASRPMFASLAAIRAPSSTPSGFPLPSTPGTSSFNGRATLRSLLERNGRQVIALPPNPATSQRLCTRFRMQ